MAKITLFDFSHENSNIWKSHEILQLWDISGDFQTLWVYVDFSCRIIITSSGIIHRPLLGLRWCHVVYLNVFRPQKKLFLSSSLWLKSCFCVIVTMINVLFYSFICQLQVRNSIVKRLKVREELWTGVHRLRGHWGWTPTGLLDLYQPRKKNLEGTFLLTFFAVFFDLEILASTVSFSPFLSFRAKN